MATMTLKIRVDEDTVLMVESRNVVDEDRFIEDCAYILTDYYFSERDVISIKTETMEYL